MTQKWDTVAEPKAAVTDDVDEILADLIEGIDTSITDYYGTADPSSGASWGATQLGTTWRDSNNAIGAGGDDLGSVLKVWAITDATPTYGWRTMNVRSYIALEPNVNTLSISSQSTTAFVDEDVTADTSARAIAVRLMVTVEDSGTPASTVFAEIRKNGTTTDDPERRIFPQAAGVPNAVMIDVELDSAQVFEYGIDASGAGTFDLRIDVLGYYERA